eukprot:SAG22_NODE_306_length_12671_cov_14.743239_2_plen_102_part_00
MYIILRNRSYFKFRNKKISQHLVHWMERNNSAAGTPLLSFLLLLLFLPLLLCILATPPRHLPRQSFALTTLASASASFSSAASSAFFSVAYPSDCFARREW